MSKIEKQFQTLKHVPDNIIISRTDSIGDVVLTLPVAAVLKKKFPGIEIGFMGKVYTKAVIEACRYVDTFIDVNDFLHSDILINEKKPQAILHVFPVPLIAERAKQLKIPLRIGTTNRVYHWTTCNKLVNLSRKNSPLHETQLNLKLLQAFGIKQDFLLDEITQLYGLDLLQPLLPEMASLIKNDRYNLILHPKSQGNGREWPVGNFIALIKLLKENMYNIFISGTQKERQALQSIFDTCGSNVTDVTGKMNLSQFLSFINETDGLVGSGTGPLHIAAALGKDALGIFPPIKPVHPARWKPVGRKAQAFVVEKNCNVCKSNAMNCQCMADVKPEQIKKELNILYFDKLNAKKSTVI